ncbi:MAG: hypothetical protein WDZ41_01565 [Candidatus Babeliales bacterium]
MKLKTFSLLLFSLFIASSYAQEGEPEVPIYFHYKGKDGGFVAIYTHKPRRTYIGNGIYLLAYLSLPGRYKDRIFIPKEYEYAQNVDISQDKKFKKIALQYLPAGWKAEDIWFGGDTGGYFSHD